MHFLAEVAVKTFFCGVNPGPIQPFYHVHESTPMHVDSHVYEERIRRLKLFVAVILAFHLEDRLAAHFRGQLFSFFAQQNLLSPPH